MLLYIQNAVLVVQMKWTKYFCIDTKYLNQRSRIPAERILEKKLNREFSFFMLISWTEKVNKYVRNQTFVLTNGDSSLMSDF